MHSREGRSRASSKPTVRPNPTRAPGASRGLWQPLPQPAKVELCIRARDKALQREPTTSEAACGNKRAQQAQPGDRVESQNLARAAQMPFLKELLVSAIAASLLLPATAVAKPADGKRHVKIVVHAKYSPKQRWHGYGFLPGYRQPPDLADWRDRSARYGGPYQRFEPRYWSGGEWRYGWGGPGFYRGRWNGGT